MCGCAVSIISFQHFSQFTKIFLKAPNKTKIINFNRRKMVNAELTRFAWNSICEAPDNFPGMKLLHLQRVAVCLHYSAIRPRMQSILRIFCMLSKLLACLTCGHVNVSSSQMANALERMARLHRVHGVNAYHLLLLFMIERRSVVDRTPFDTCIKLTTLQVESVNCQIVRRK